MKKDVQMASAASQSWLYWALLSALFAALTAIFAKVGISEISSDLATFFRTIIIVIVLGGILYATDQFQLNSPEFSRHLGAIINGNDGGVCERKEIYG